MSIWNRLGAFFSTYLVEPFRHFEVIDAIDILLLAAALFFAYRFAKGRRAGRVFLGLVIVIAASAVVTLFQLPALTFIVKMVASSFFICFVLIFQPEIRTALERLGNSKLVNPWGDTLPRRKLPLARMVTNETVEAVFKMSDSCTGALIVFEGSTKLGDCIESGRIVDARVSSSLLQNIFFNKAPLHDGALIIRDFRIHAASCVLPSASAEIEWGNMGTRHRAAVGVTEVSDAFVIVVSEQTGIISVAQGGKLLRGVSRESLKDMLMTYLAGELYLRIKSGSEDPEEEENDFEWLEKTTFPIFSASDIDRDQLTIETSPKSEKDNAKKEPTKKSAGAEEDVKK